MIFDKINPRESLIKNSNTAKAALPVHLYRLVWDCPSLIAIKCSCHQLQNTGRQLSFMRRHTGHREEERTEEAAAKNEKATAKGTREFCTLALA